MTQTQSYGHGRPISTGQQPVLKIVKDDESAIKIESDEISNRLTAEDWTDFRSLLSLCRRAGVTPDRLLNVVAKELVDNGLDASDDCTVFQCGRSSIHVDDEGAGIPGSDEEIARLFSIRRPRESSKLMRLPSRGALGNGLRVVVGAVLVSGGYLVVATRGRRLRLKPQDDGSTIILSSEPCETNGTCIGVHFGTGFGEDVLDTDCLKWARQAHYLAKFGEKFKGKPSPYWFESETWFELLHAHHAMPVRQFLEKLEGLSGGKAGKAAKGFLGRRCDSLSRDEADELLGSALDLSKPVKVKRLGSIGENETLGTAYAREFGEMEIDSERGIHTASIPFVVEAWARPSQQPSLIFCVNRTPVTSEPYVKRDDSDRCSYALHSANLYNTFKVGRRDFAITVNITTPYIPILNDGKSPDVWRMWDELEKALVKAVNRAKTGSGSEAVSQIDVIRESVDDAIREVSDGGKYRYSLRQLYYAIRPTLLQKIGREPKYGTFAQHITTIESERGGDLPGIYRDNRGVLYHPHTGETIPLGTQSIERYERPKWSFSKVLYCEKEGFFPSLQAAKWPERHDCALVTGKGYASRAARDLLDLLGGSDEPLKIFCIHDADGPGTVIYESLAGATKARGEREVEIINLGLDPAEALDMGLAVENVDKKRQGKVPVAGYIQPKWREWLQTKRVELNAMTPAQLIAWLDRKMAEHGGTKVIPPAEVQREYLDEKLEAVLREELTERAIQEYDVDGKAKAAIKALEARVDDVAGSLDERIRGALAESPADWWRSPVEQVAKELAETRLAGDWGKP